MRNDTPISDDGPSSLLGPEQIEHLEFTATAMEKKLDYGEKGINMAMDKLHDINRVSDKNGIVAPPITILVYLHENMCFCNLVLT
jgi:hypothetical protein